MNTNYINLLSKNSKRKIEKTDIQNYGDFYFLKTEEKDTSLEQGLFVGYYLFYKDTVLCSVLSDYDFLEFIKPVKYDDKKNLWIIQRIGGTEYLKIFNNKGKLVYFKEADYIDIYDDYINFKTYNSCYDEQADNGIVFIQDILKLL